VEPVAGGIAVDVDRGALLAEAAAIAAESPAEPPASGAADAPAADSPPPSASPSDPAARATEVKPAVCDAVAKLSTFLAPNWNVTRAESDAVGESLALVLAYWMPETSIDPKYVALGTLAMSLWSVASSRRDENGQWRPLRQPAERQDDTAPKRSSAAGASLSL